MKNVYFITLGCPKNRVDSEIMAAIMLENGYKMVQDPEDADILIVNSCGFIDQSKQESIEVIFEMAQYKEEDPDKKLVVTGCLSQRYQNEIIDDLPEVDHFLGTGSFVDILKVLEDNKRSHFTTSHFLQTDTTPRINSLYPHTAYLKIAEGCSNSCSFCIIPKIRGKQRSREIKSIISEAKLLVNSGVKEINLLAQELTAYGSDLVSKPNLTQLLKELVKIDKLEWIRLFYTYPDRFSDSLIDIIAENSKICNYIDLPLQHISNPVLKRMFRGDREYKIRDLIDKLRTKIPDVALRGSFIVGFPGETEEDFEKLYKFVEETKFEHLGVFQYSPEEGTKAATYSDQIEETIKEERQNIIMELQNGISNKILKSYIGKTIPVIVDGLSDETDLLLAGRHQKQGVEIDGITYINDGTAKRGDIVSVKITQSGDYDLVGHIIK